MSTDQKIKVGVGAFIIDSEDRIFLGKRSKSVDLNPGRWESSGGKVEFGETLTECLQREIREEHGVEIAVGEMIGIVEYIVPDKNQHWVGPAYVCKITSGTPRIMEPDKCEQIGWFTLEEALQLPLTPFAERDLENYRIWRDKQNQK